MAESTKFLGPNEAFAYPAEFGFSGSRSGTSAPRNHPVDPDDSEYGDGSYVSRMRQGGKVKRMADGGSAGPMPGAPMAGGPMPGGPMPQPGMPAAPMASAQQAMPGGAPAGQETNSNPLNVFKNATISMPVEDAAKAAGALVAQGRAAGAKAAVGALTHLMASRRAAMAQGAQGMPQGQPQAQPQQAMPAMRNGGHLSRKG